MNPLGHEIDKCLHPSRARLMYRHVLTHGWETDGTLPAAEKSRAIYTEFTPNVGCHEHSDLTQSTQDTTSL